MFTKPPKTLPLVQREVWSCPTSGICDPVAFVNRAEGRQASSFSRVVVWTVRSGSGPASFLAVQATAVILLSGS